MIGKLYIIATPIGNLQDVTNRAIETLRQVDVLYCEDTRVTKRLLDRYEIKVKTESYREQVHLEKATKIVELLRAGLSVGLVSDAGTPGVSDPGTRLVQEVLNQEPEAVIIPIPGASAVISAISVAGFPADAFSFLGFPPHKKGRNSFFTEAMQYNHPVIMYESPHRILKALNSIMMLEPDRNLCVLRELTKMYETIYRGNAQTVMEKLGDKPKGEFVIVLDRKSKH